MVSSFIYWLRDKTSKFLLGQINSKNGSVYILRSGSFCSHWNREYGTGSFPMKTVYLEPALKMFTYFSFQIPDGCPSEIFRHLMKDCWNLEPKHRPKFIDLVLKCKQFIDEYNWILCNLNWRKLVCESKDCVLLRIIRSVFVYLKKTRHLAGRCAN